MGNAQCQYPTRVPKSTRLSWSNAEGVPRIFTPWDTEECPGIDLHSGLDLPQKAVRFLLGDPTQIPQFVSSSPHHKRVHSIDPAALKSILKSSPRASKRPTKRRHRRVRSLTRRISNSKVEVIPYYFTKRGVPTADDLLARTKLRNHTREPNDADESKAEDSRQPTVDNLASNSISDYASEDSGSHLQDSIESYSSEGMMNSLDGGVFSELNLQTLKEECTKTSLGMKLVSS